MHPKLKTDFLVATPSIQSGAARLFDWYGLYDDYNYSLTTTGADRKAVYCDWYMVGRDIFDAMEAFRTSWDSPKTLCQSDSTAAEVATLPPR